MLKDFSKGKKSLRPAPFWSWNDRLNKTELLSQMQKMRDAGYGGFFMHSRVGLVTEYMSEEWLDLVRLCAEKSAELGLDAYLYDEDMWPSGYAGGEVPALSDEFKERALVLVGNAELRNTDEVFKTVEKDGKTLYIAKRITPAGNLRFGGQCYIDAMNPSTIQAFLQSTHEKYKTKVADLFGTNIKGIFTDEPCYGMHWFYTVPHVPYSECLQQRIQREKGYDIRECCDELFFDTGSYKKTRYDYFTLAGNQLCESYIKQYADWCGKNGIACTGHLMAEETLYEQAEWTGGVMQNYAYMQHPGVDKLQRGVEQLVTLKQLTSVTEQVGKDRALSECFAGIGHESGFIKRKQIIDWQAINGITFVNMHLSHYSLWGERKRDYPPDIFYQQPYFKEEKLFSDYTARLCQLAGYGRRYVSTLVILPLGSVFAGYNPNDRQNKQKLKIYDDYVQQLSLALQASHVDFHYGDEEILSKHAKCEGGKLMVGGYEYDTVILCHVESLSTSTVQLLKEFTGRTVALGQKPTLCEYRSSISVRVDESFDCVEKLILAIKDKAFAEIDADGIIGCRRVGPMGDVYLFANTGDEQKSLKSHILHGSYVLDITNGNAYPLGCDEALIYPCGSLAVFTGSEDALFAWGIEIKPAPTILADGARLSIYTERKIPVPKGRRVNENALVIDRADFVCGELSFKDAPLQSLWHYHFYKLPDGTPYEMCYRFEVRELPSSPVYIIVENAENADSITLNGQALTPMRKRGEEQLADEKVYIDLSFTRCPALGLKVGENEIVIKARKVNNITEVCNHRHVTESEHYATEAEAVYVVGDFGVKTCEKGHFICKAEQIYGNAVDFGCPFYSGAIEYDFNHSFNCEQLVLEADCAVATVEVDGKKHVAGGYPLVFDTRELTGKKQVKITLYNTLYGLLGPHRIIGYDNLIWVDPGVFNDMSKYSNTCLTKPFGLKEIKTICNKERKNEDS